MCSRFLLPSVTLPLMLVTACRPSLPARAAPRVSLEGSSRPGRPGTEPTAPLDLLPLAEGEPLRGAPRVTIDHRAIAVDGVSVALLHHGRLLEAEKADGPEGRFVIRLYRRLRDLQAAAGPAGSSRCFALAATARTRHDTVLAVLHTAGEAGFRCYQIAAIRPPESRPEVVGIPMTYAISSRRVAGADADAPGGYRRYHDALGRPFWALAERDFPTLLPWPRSMPGRPAEPSAASPRALDAAAIRDVIRRHLPEVQRCYTTIGLRARTGLAGRVKVSFTILPDGSVSQVTMAETTLSHAPTERCILAAVKRWRFPRPEGQAPVVTYPFTFKPRD